jgi:pimeloyl-ACP methyl ester carboxylesterase
MKKTVLMIIASLGICTSVYSHGYGQENFIKVNGKNVEILISGLEHNQMNKPVIVFENGRGTTFDYWEKVISEVSKESVIFAYNRPRIGKSEDDNIPPSMKHIVDNLRIMLKEKGLNPPYLLVGHSFGACYIRSFASYYPDEVAGLIFVDPHDFTQRLGYNRLPYQEIGLTERQIDSIFASYKNSGEQYLLTAPKHHLEELKIAGELSETGHQECYQNPLPDIPVHFIMAGGFSPYNEEPPFTVWDREKMFRIHSNIKMKRWLELLYPLKYGRFFYHSNSGHAIQIYNPELVITSIEMAQSDYNSIRK